MWSKLHCKMIPDNKWSVIKQSLWRWWLGTLLIEWHRFGDKGLHLPLHIQAYHVVSFTGSNIHIIMLVGFWFSELTYKSIKDNHSYKREFNYNFGQYKSNDFGEKKSNVLTERSGEIQRGEDMEESKENSNLLNGESGYYLKLID